MPSGMLQQMQRQLRGGGMQEMMKAMMQGQGGDQMDMDEMQREWISVKKMIAMVLRKIIKHRDDVAGG